jgi:hypothetical protein
MKRYRCLTAILVLASSSVAHPQEIVLDQEIPNWFSPLYWTPPQRLAKELTSEITAEPMGVEAVPTNTLPFVGVTPCRMVDTRGNGFAGAYGPPLLTAGVSRNFTLTGQCGIPGNAEAVSLNVTVTNTQGPGHIVIFPQGGAEPTVSTLNYVAGQTIANAAIVPLGAGGGITVIAGVSGTDLIVDTNGYYGPSLDSICVNEGQNNSITSSMIVDGTIVNADINAAAAIADTKLATIATAGKVADSALSANVSKLGQTIEAGEITNVTRSVSIPLTSFIDCQTEPHRPLDFTSEVDTIANLTSNATDGMGTTILFDADAGTEDQDSEICSNLSVPADYASGGIFRVRVAKAVPPSGDTEVLTCGVSVNLGALQAPGATEIPFAGNISYVCSPTIVSLGPGNSLSFYLSITSSGTMNEQVRILSVAFEYTASQ